MLDLYIALEDMDFEWSRSKIEEVLEYWNKGDSLEKIAYLVKRDIDEIALLIMDLGNKLFKPRSNGIYSSNRLTNFSSKEIQKRKRFFRNKSSYLVFSNCGKEFFWKSHEILTVELLWNTGLSVQVIAKRIKRKAFEIILLIMDRCKKQSIYPRNHGLGERHVG